MGQGLWFGGWGAWSCWWLQSDLERHGICFVKTPSEVQKKGKISVVSLRVNFAVSTTARSKSSSSRRRRRRRHRRGSSRSRSRSGFWLRSLGV